VEKLPLFPLNTVLFPGMPLSLHIFEERYKLMIGQCIAQRRPFGVVLLRSGAAEARPGQAIEPYRVGCSATITQVQPMGMGKMNIVALGEDRFTIHALEHDQPYLVGLVDRQPHAPEADYDREAMSHALRRWVERYLGLIARFETLPLDQVTLPTDPLRLAFLGMSILKAPMDDKQAVLQARTELEAIELASALMRREIALLDVMARPVPGDSDSVFSVN
jgi:Lon protease-like protein